MFNIQGFLSPSFPADLRSLNVSGVRELCLIEGETVPNPLRGGLQRSPDLVRPYD